MDKFLKMRLDMAKQEEVDRSKYNFPSAARVEEIKHTFTNSLISIGIDPRNKDLLEVIADLADELNKTKAELNDLKNEMYSKIDNIEKEIKQ